MLPASLTFLGSISSTFADVVCVRQYCALKIWNSLWPIAFGNSANIWQISADKFVQKAQVEVDLKWENVDKIERHFFGKCCAQTNFTWRPKFSEINPWFTIQVLNWVKSSTINRPFSLLYNGGQCNFKLSRRWEFLFKLITWWSCQACYKNR